MFKTLFVMGFCEQNTVSEVGGQGLTLGSTPRWFGINCETGRACCMLTDFADFGFICKYLASQTREGRTWSLSWLRFLD